MLLIILPLSFCSRGACVPRRQDRSHFYHSVSGLLQLLVKDVSLVAGELTVLRQSRWDPCSAVTGFLVRCRGLASPKEAVTETRSENEPGS